MSANLEHYPVNPAYGAGAFRRRIALWADGAVARAEMLDDFHEMAVSVTVEDGLVAHVSADMRRFPKTTCRGAIAALEGMRGMAEAGVLGKLDRSAHCTHLLDLARLALGWRAQGQGQGERVIEIALTDRDAQGQQHLELRVNSDPALVLCLRNEAIVEPQEWTGRSLFGGFGRWVGETFAPDEADLWRIAQMAVFVARGRAYVVDGPDARSVAEEPSRLGACFSFSDPAFAIARDNVGYVRDMSDGLPPHRRNHDNANGKGLGQ